MNKLKKLYRDFFGLTEQTSTTTQTQLSVAPAKLNDPNVQKQIKQGVKVRVEGDLDEAQLINNITDYRGGVEYVLRDPADAKAVATEIRQWTEKKGFTIVKQDISASGRIGYFYFRLGQDPALESQKIQGYIAQKPEIKHFRFNVRGEREASVEPVAEPKRIIRRNPNINI
jgi:hypothetical protein